MRNQRDGLWLGLLALLLAGGHPAHAGVSVYRIDPTSSTVEVRTGKSGLFGGFGHSHEIAGSRLRGEVRADEEKLSASSVDVTLEATSLKVLDRVKESEVAEIQHTMESDKVLDVSKFAVIRFRSTRVAGSGAKGQPYRLDLTGDLEFHGVTKQLQTPAEVTLDGDKLQAHGEFVVRQRDFGIRPFSGGLGMVKVANEVRIRFRIVARRRK
ncbi:MAG: YceI family protein [Candidatus Wallbacteria bacterium]|nr:YceI family protein [Candidatus Wallbacteria bacterium]